MSRSNENIAWYTPSEWVKVRAVSSDPDSMGLTYEEWLHGVEALKKQLEAGGAAVSKVYIDAEALLAFARRAGHRLIDNSVRTEFTIS